MQYLHQGLIARYEGIHKFEGFGEFEVEAMSFLSSYWQDGHQLDEAKGEKEDILLLLRFKQKLDGLREVIEIYGELVFLFAEFQTVLVLIFEQLDLALIRLVFFTLEVNSNFEGLVLACADAVNFIGLTFFEVDLLTEFEERQLEREDLFAVERVLVEKR